MFYFIAGILFGLVIIYLIVAYLTIEVDVREHISLMEVKLLNILEKELNENTAYTFSSFTTSYYMDVEIKDVRYSLTYSRINNDYSLYVKIGGMIYNISDITQKEMIKILKPFYLKAYNKTIEKQENLLNNIICKDK